MLCMLGLYCVMYFQFQPKHGLYQINTTIHFYPALESLHLILTFTRNLSHIVTFSLYLYPFLHVKLKPCGSRYEVNVAINRLLTNKHTHTHNISFLYTYEQTNIAINEITQKKRNRTKKGNRTNYVNIIYGRMIVNFFIAFIHIIKKSTMPKLRIHVNRSKMF